MDMSLKRFKNVIIPENDVTIRCRWLQSVWDWKHDKLSLTPAISDMPGSPWKQTQEKNIVTLGVLRLQFSDKYFFGQIFVC